jgi:ankyrin repeat protein
LASPLTTAFNRAAARAPRDIDLHMMRALIKGDRDTALALIARGGDVNYRNQPGETPLMAASLRSDATLVQALLERGADINAQDAEGNTALHWLARADWTRDIPAIAHHMLDCGADAGMKNKKGETAAYVATRLNKERLARILGDDGHIPAVKTMAAENAIEVVKPIKLKSTAPPPEPQPAPTPAPKREEPAGESISDMSKRYAKAGLFG